MCLLGCQQQDSREKKPQNTGTTASSKEKSNHVAKAEIEDNFSNNDVGQTKQPCNKNDLKNCLKNNSFTNGVGGYTADELNAALITMFGELSAQPHDKLSEEAEAIASTIFNRKTQIDEAREADQVAGKELKQARANREKALKHHDELARNPSKYKKELGEAAYNKKLKNAKEDYKTANSALGKAQNKKIATNSAKMAAESYVSEDKRNGDVTLTDIVAQNEQYEGTKTGQDYYDKYENMSEANQKRNCQRWKTAKAALEKLAKNPSERDNYDQFRSNYNGKRTLKKGETRIGGNDFWKSD